MSQAHKGEARAYSNTKPWTPLLRQFHLKTARTVQNLRCQVDVQGVIQGVVGEGGRTEPAQFGTGFMHGLATVHVVPTDGEDALNPAVGTFGMDGHGQAAAG
jgi:hypothetical protein